MKQLVQWGGATAVIVALTILLKALGSFIEKVKINGSNKKIKERLTKIEENDLVHLIERVDDIDERLRTVEQDKVGINYRLEAIETTLKQIKKKVGLNG